MQAQRGTLNSRPMVRASVIHKKPVRKAVDLDRTKSFPDATIMFSVDISESTRGRMLTQEICAIKRISAELSTSAYNSSHVGPWCGKTKLLRPIDSVTELSCHKGTNPCSIVDDQAHVTTIQHADMWFLLTDGVIRPDRITEFARKIPQYGLHAKPCVIIVFGHRPARPVMANISVGVSLYGVTPDCLFLFHEAVSEQVYIIQSKGCFDVLNTKKSSGAALDETTHWIDLPTLDYKTLSTVQISTRTELGQNEILLQEGRSIDIDNLLSSRLAPSDNDAVLGNQDNLNAVLLTASTRGRGGEVKQWLQNQKVNRGLTIARRADIGDAGPLVAKILAALDRNTKADQMTVNRLRKRLKSAHQTNWMELVRRSTTKRSVQDHDAKIQVMDDALERMNMIDDTGTSSPVVLSPVGSNRRTPSSASHQSTIQSNPNDPSQTRRSSSVLPYRDQSVLPYKEPPIQPSAVNVSEAASQTVFLPGYRRSGGSVHLWGSSCFICEQLLASPTILLKDYPRETPTQGFIPPNSGARVSCPLVLALYPETDVLSRLVCCDSCAFHTTTSQHIFRGEKIIGALPVPIDMNDKVNLETWLATVDRVLEGRFRRDTLPAVMLGVATWKLDQVQSNMTEQDVGVRNVLVSLCNELVTHSYINSSAGRPIAVSAAARDFDHNLCHWLKRPIPGGGPDTNDLMEPLQYPIETFLLILRYAENLDSFSQARCLYIKFIMHMIEQSTSPNIDTRKQSAFLINSRPTCQSSSNGASSRTTASTPTITTYNMLDLVHAGLIDSVGYTMLVASGDPWQTIVAYCMPAVNCAVQLLAKGDWPVPPNPLSILKRWLANYNFGTVCLTPWDPTAVKLLQHTIGQL